MTKVIINGASGKMGQALIRLVKDDPALTLVGAADKKSGDGIAASLKDVIALGDIVIDFSLATATDELLDIAKGARKALIIGTTGHSNEQKVLVLKASKEIPILMAPNMSIGVNLLFKLTELASKTLGKDYSIKIEETHHIHKKDSPSGTAKGILEAAVKGGKHNMESDVFCAEVNTEKCQTNKLINVFAFRKGEVVGDHTISFSNKEEVLSLTHNALTRDVFAKGALKAAKWLAGKPAGLYNMQDVLF